MFLASNREKTKSKKTQMGEPKKKYSTTKCLELFMALSDGRIIEVKRQPDMSMYVQTEVRSSTHQTGKTTQFTMYAQYFISNLELL